MKNFYLSITKELLMKSLNYAKSIEAINEKVVKVIMHSCKLLLFDRDNVLRTQCFKYLIQYGKNRVIWG